ncbi:starvation-inducible protein [Vibrio sp. 10N.286.49.B3]|uniref:Slp family lipoprotein n=1 Tax=Vibrio sp. 10N.286.49.B3 TaxID=1880855 RepID=UPI000C81CFC1|nr:Slp family lipoprotein [Vibrio sp. 10N.286.49.B3]PMH41894.1 starvation-inducible protein [Vibrio sp. 10N.286.49.B3]
MKTFFARAFSLLSLITFLSACTSLPSELTAQSEVLISDYSTWLNADPSLQTDVRLGGVIAKVDNLATKSRIEVVNLPINKSGQPDITQDPQGRFIAYVPGYVEPVAFAQGRLVTFVGKTAMPEAGKVGEFDYTFPVMEAYGQRLWRIEERIIMNDFDRAFDNCRSFHCRAFDYGPREARVIQNVK